MRYLDTHCHIDLANNRDKFIKEISTDRRYTIGVTNLPKLFQKNKVLIPETKFIKHALGYHPELIEQFPNEIEIFERLVHKTRYIGEVGIDGSLKYRKTFNKQFEVFDSVLDICKKESNKIITVHSRNAVNEVLYLLKKNVNNKIILHWFTGDINDAKQFINLGNYFSFNHKMLVTNKGKILAKNVPQEQILLESDFPFGTSDKQNLSNQYFIESVRMLSQIKNINSEIFIQQLRDNQKNLLK